MRHWVGWCNNCAADGDGLLSQTARNIHQKKGVRCVDQGDVRKDHEKQEAGYGP